MLVFCLSNVGHFEIICSIEMDFVQQTFADFLNNRAYVISYCVRWKIPSFLKVWDPTAGRWTRVVHVSRTWARHIYSRTILCHPCARCDWIFRGICFRRRFFVYLFQWRGNKQLLQKNYCNNNGGKQIVSHSVSLPVYFFHTVKWYRNWSNLF